MQSTPESSFTIFLIGRSGFVAPSPPPPPPSTKNAHTRCIMQVGLCRFGCCNTSFVSRFLHSIYSQLQRGVHRDVIGGGGCSFTIVRSGPYLFSVVVKLTCLLTQDAMLCVVTQGPSLFRAFSSPRGHVAMSHCQKSNVALFMGTSEEHGQLLLHLDCLHW